MPHLREECVLLDPVSVGRHGGKYFQLEGGKGSFVKLAPKAWSFKYFSAYVDILLWVVLFAAFSQLESGFMNYNKSVTSE